MGERLRAVMPVNWTLGARSTTGAGVEKPRGSAQRRVKQDDRQKTDDCEKGAPAALVINNHLRPKLPKSYAKRTLVALRPCKPLGYSRVWNQFADGRPNLDLACAPSQTRSMAHAYGIYIRFDFGTDEEKAQQARHKLEGWRQAFRLDKRVQYKMERPESATPADAATAKPVPAEKPAAKTKEKPVKASVKAAGKSSDLAAAKAMAKSDAAANGKVGLLVRLYFSPHEKLSEQRWLTRIPGEEPFKSASPKVINHEHPEFEATDQQFEAIPVGEAGGRST